MVMFVLLSSGASAHAVMDTAPINAYNHTLIQTADHALHRASAGNTTDAVAVLHHADTCSHSHCSHSHAASVMTAHSAYTASGTVRAVPVSSERWASSAITNNIERPKWRAITPAVVSLLA